MFDMLDYITIVYKDKNLVTNGNTTCSSCFMHSADFLSSKNNSTSFIAHKAPVSLLSKRHKSQFGQMRAFSFFFIFFSFIKKYSTDIQNFMVNRIVCQQENLEK